LALQQLGMKEGGFLASEELLRKGPRDDDRIRCRFCRLNPLGPRQNPTNLFPDKIKSSFTKINRKNISKCLKMGRPQSKPFKIKKAHFSGCRRRLVTPKMDFLTHVTKWDTPVRASVRQLRQIGHIQEFIRDITGISERTQRL